MYLRQVVESCAVDVLLLQALGVAEGQGVESWVRGLLATGNQEVVVEQLGGEIHYGLVGTVVLTQHDHAGALAGVKVVEALQKRNVKSLLSRIAGVHFWADLKEAIKQTQKTTKVFISSFCKKKKKKKIPSVLYICNFCLLVTKPE